MRREACPLELGNGKMSQMVLTGVCWVAASFQGAAGNATRSREETSKKPDQDIGVIMLRAG